MNPMIRTAFVCFLATFAARQAFASTEPPLMTKPGDIIFQDDFSQPELKTKWNVGKGDWKVADGVVTAAELPADAHAAYSYVKFKPKFIYKDLLAEFSFKIDTAKSVQLNIRDSNYKESHAGHIARVAIDPTSVNLADWKTGAMKYHDQLKDPKTTESEKKEIFEKIKDKSATFKVKTDPTKWHKARVELIGDEMLVSIDGNAVAYLKSEGLDHETKNMIGFTVAGQSAEIKDPKFMTATVSDLWSSRRTHLVARLKKAS